MKGCISYYESFHSTHLPTPSHPKALISLEASKCHSRDKDWLYYLTIGHLSSGNGGYFTKDMLSDLCGFLNIKKGTAKAHIRNCVKKELAHPHKEGWKWVSQESLHLANGGDSSYYLGKYAVETDIYTLLAFLPLSKKVFKGWLTREGHLVALAKSQRDAVNGLESMERKVLNGEEVFRTDKQTSEKVPVTIDWVKERLEHYNKREFVFEGAPYSHNLAYANTIEWQAVRNKRKGDPTSNNTDAGSRVGEKKNTLKPKASNARCPIKFGSPRGVSTDSEDLFTLNRDNVSVIYSPYKLDKRSIQFDSDWRGKSGSQFKGISLEGMHRTEVMEANASLKVLQAKTGYSMNTVNSYLKASARELGNFIIREHYLVIGAYEEGVVTKINAMSQKENSLRGRFFARRMRSATLSKAIARGVSVEFRNINGSIESVKDEPMLTVLVFQRSYYLINEVKEGFLTPKFKKSGENDEKVVTLVDTTPLNREILTSGKEMCPLDFPF